ncbi:MAG: hypothetical protein MJE68_26560, partial [Proteobacteria bacterium]|nr:hypothetical protein [Pseudomonadota bacterium]
KYISDSLVAKELWQRKQTSPSGCALGIGSFTAIIPWPPVNNYNLHMIETGLDLIFGPDTILIIMGTLICATFSFLGYTSLCRTSKLRTDPTVSVKRMRSVFLDCALSTAWKRRS